VKWDLACWAGGAVVASRRDNEERTNVVVYFDLDKSRC